MTKTFNGTRTIVNIPGSAAAPLGILATGPCVALRVVESGLTAQNVANTMQGFDVLIRDDGSATGFTQYQRIAPGTIFTLSDRMALTDPRGSMIGNGPGNIIGIGPTPATTLFYARSSSATSTSLLVQQDYD